MMADNMRWVGTWTTTPAPAEGVAFANQTFRMNARASIGGDRLRVRLSNAYGSRPLLVGAAYLGLRDAGSGVVSGSNKRLSFGGADSVTIAAGALAVSDPVAFALPPLADVAVSIYLPGDLPANFGITGRYARQINYVSPPGNFASEAVMPQSPTSDVDSAEFACKLLILPLFWRDGSFHPRGAGGREWPIGWISRSTLNWKPG